MSKKIGVIAEDKSDIAVIEEILCKYINKKSFSIRSFTGQGCGKLKSKCASWADNLIKAGCDHILLFHDLDRNKLSKLRLELEAKFDKKKNVLVVIPVEEIEAWLLSDAEAIKKVFSLKNAPKISGHCETIASPKEYLANLVWLSDKKRYLNTVHNVKISQELSLEKLRKCQSFIPLDNYLVQHV